MKVIESIREIREKKAITQQFIADALNVDKAVVSNIEKGKRDVRLGELEVISTCLGVSLVDLITYPEKYVKASNQKESEPVEAVIQIKLSGKKRDEVLKTVFGKKDIELLNK